MVKKTISIEDKVKAEVDDIISSYKDKDIEELNRAEIAVNIALNYLKVNKELKKFDGFGTELGGDNENE
jgi:hypothetical protein